MNFIVSHLIGPIPQVESISEIAAHITSQQSHKSAIFDDSHYIATLLLALRNIRVDSFDKNDENDLLK
jgi:hypothetical protein